MIATNVIRKPVLTEKSTIAMNEMERYCFEVDMKATKKEIKAAVEEIYKVTVEKVNTRIDKGRFRRLKYGVVPPKFVKKAYVRLKEGQRIELF